MIERNPPDATYGWGVVFSERTFTAFQDADSATAREITQRLVTWDAIDIVYRGERIRTGGQAFAGISRKVLLGILQRRCAELGVELQFRREITDPAALGDLDLLVAADGVHSAVRTTLASIFAPSIVPGRARFIWLGTHRLLDAFTFIFKANEHGLFQAHAYPFDGTTSTFIVECDERTWRRAGLDQLPDAEGIAYCERLFAGELQGRPLLSNNSRWISFSTLKTKTWRHGRIVLLGDAAHTAHFSIGSGTKLAMEDAVALAGALERHRDMDTALNWYEAERRPIVEAFQDAAQESQQYFETIRRYTHLTPLQFSFHLLTRSGRLTFDDLQLRDPQYVARVSAWFARPDGTGPAAVAPPPLLTPIHLRGLRLGNRVALAVTPAPTAHDGMPHEQHRAEVVRRARLGAGVVLGESMAVSPDGRISSGDLGLYAQAQAEAWTGILTEARRAGATRFAAVLNHAGRRGATRPRTDGVDRPVADGGWPLLAPSALPYSPQARRPEAMDRSTMTRVREDFVRSALLAGTAGMDLILLHAAHGYLLGSFLSPLTNLRTDDFGGPLENRLRYVLEILDAVRVAWPADRPLGAVLNATDCVRGGWRVDDAVAAASAFRDHGCDLIMVMAGGTTPEGIHSYDRRYLPALADRIRNEAGIATLATGTITTLNDVNTLVAGGRADVCLLLGRPSAPAPWTARSARSPRSVLPTSAGA